MTATRSEKQACTCLCNGPTVWPRAHSPPALSLRFPDYRKELHEVTSMILFHSGLLWFEVNLPPAGTAPLLLLPRPSDPTGKHALPTSLCGISRYKEHRVQSPQSSHLHTACHPRGPTGAGCWLQARGQHVTAFFASLISSPAVTPPSGAWKMANSYIPSRNPHSPELLRKQRLPHASVQ